MRASDSGVYVSVMSAADDKKLTEWYFDDDELDEKGVPCRRRIIPWLYGQYVYFEVEDFHRPCICDFIVVYWDGREVFADTIAPRPRENGFIDAHYTYLANRVEIRFGDFGRGAQRFRLPDQPRDDVASGGTIKIEVWSKLRRVNIDAPPSKARRTVSRSQGVRDVLNKGILRATVLFQYRTDEWRAEHGCLLEGEKARKRPPVPPPPKPTSSTHIPPSNVRAAKSTMSPHPSNAPISSSAVRAPPQPRAPTPDVRAPVVPVRSNVSVAYVVPSTRPSLPSPPSSNMGNSGASAITEAQISWDSDALRDQSFDLEDRDLHLAYPIKLEVDELEDKFHPEEVAGVGLGNGSVEEQDLADELELLIIQRKRKENSIVNQLSEITYQGNLRRPTYDLKIKLCQMRRTLIQDKIEENALRHKLAGLTAPPDAHSQRAFEQGQAQLTDEGLAQELEERQLGIEKRRASLKRPVEIIEID